MTPAPVITTRGGSTRWEAGNNTTQYQFCKKFRMFWTQVKSRVDEIKGGGRRIASWLLTTFKSRGQKCIEIRPGGTGDNSPTFRFCLAPWGGTLSEISAKV